MAEDNFPTCLEFTLQAEGGWVDNPQDPGGCTAQGITLNAYCAWKNNWLLTCDDLAMISPQEVHDFYYGAFWLLSDADSLPTGIDLMVFDAGVNIGVGTSIKLLQQQVHVTDDGIIGPITLSAVHTMDATMVINALASAQTTFYQGLNDFDVFGRGWLNRVVARKTMALTMLATV